MESHPLRPVKRAHRPHRLCNELVCEFCRAIPMLKASERILLTSANIHTYLGPRFRKMRLIYRDLIAFLKAKLKTNKTIGIWIDGVAQQNNTNEPIVVINQVQSNNEFVLETNYLRIRCGDQDWYRKEINMRDSDAQCAHLRYFLRLIAPLIKPIHLVFYWSDEPIEHLMRFLNALSGCIHSIGLNPKQFNSAKFDEALGKFNKLEIFCSRYPSVPIDVPKLVHWLTNGQSKKYLFLGKFEVKCSLKLVDEIKKDFVRAKSKCRFFVHLELWKQLDEFTVCNELTGEKLELRRNVVKYGRDFYALSRFPNNGMNNIEGDSAEFDPLTMTAIICDCE